MTRWHVERHKPSDFSDVLVYRVRTQPVSDYFVTVWWSNDRQCLNCTMCSGPLQAMLSSCPHSQAVRRARKRGL